MRLTHCHLKTSRCLIYLILFKIQLSKQIIKSRRQILIILLLCCQLQIRYRLLIIILLHQQKRLHLSIILVQSLHHIVLFYLIKHLPCLIHPIHFSVCSCLPNTRLTNYLQIRWIMTLNIPKRRCRTQEISLMQFRFSQQNPRLFHAMHKLLLIIKILIFRFFPFLFVSRWLLRNRMFLYCLTTFLYRTLHLRRCHALILLITNRIHLYQLRKIIFRTLIYRLLTLNIRILGIKSNIIFRTHLMKTTCRTRILLRRTPRDYQQHRKYINQFFHIYINAFFLLLL